VLNPFNKNRLDLENTNIYKNYFAELFLIFLVYLFCFVIFPEDNINISLAAFSTHNIKLKKREPIYS
jgi:hypothetical protein